jgi:methylated-DNA-[protein]-cysteine S-methyltransferase
MWRGSMKSPIGPLTIVGDETGLRAILFGEGIAEIAEPSLSGPRSGVIGETILQLRAYFDRKLDRFDLPLRPEGTPFQMEVWRELQRIPYGAVISYGELARRLGKPGASRAVGAANGSNPIPIVIPCHRVIGSNGRMTGYGGGLEIKEALLQLENARLF